MLIKGVRKLNYYMDKKNPANNHPRSDNLKSFSPLNKTKPGINATLQLTRKSLV